MSEKIRQIEEKIRKSITFSNELAFNEELLNELDIFDSFSKVFEKLPLILEQTLVSSSESQVKIAGSSFVFGVKTSLNIIFLEDGEDNTSVEVSGRLVEGGQLILSNLISHFNEISIDQINGFSVKNFNTNFATNTNNFKISIFIQDTWRFSLGISQLEVSDLLVIVNGEPGGITSGEIQGTTKIANASATISGALKSDLSITGVLNSLELFELLEYLNGNLLTLPKGFPSINLPDTEFLINLNESSPSFTGRCNHSDFGEIKILVQKVSEKWESALILTPDSLKFSQIADVLKPLDELNISSVTVSISSVSDEFEVPDFSGALTKNFLSEGFNLSSALKLDAVGLNFVADLIGIKEMPLSLALPKDTVIPAVSANLGDRKEVIPTVLFLDKSSLIIEPTNPLSIRLSCVAEVKVPGNSTDLPIFEGAVNVMPAGVAFYVKTKEPWVEPFGISGMPTINEVAFEMSSGPPPQYGVYGSISTAEETIEMACKLSGSMPTLLYGSLKGELTVVEIAKFLVDPRVDLQGMLPDDLIDISVSDAKISIVPNPLGETIAGIRFEPGLTLKGTLNTFGLEALLDIRVDPTKGIYAHGSLNKKVDVEDVLTISNATEDGPPFITLDTTKSPYLRISGMVSLLGLSTTVDTSLDKSGLLIRLEQAAFRQAKFDLESSVSSLDNLKLSSKFNISFDEKVGPIQITSGGPSLGRVNIKASFDGTFDALYFNDNFSGSIKGSCFFPFLGNLEFLEIKMEQKLTSLASVLESVKSKLFDKVLQGFKDRRTWTRAVILSNLGPVGIIEDPKIIIDLASVDPIEAAKFVLDGEDSVRVFQDVASVWAYGFRLDDKKVFTLLKESFNITNPALILKILGERDAIVTLLKESFSLDPMQFAQYWQEFFEFTFEGDFKEGLARIWKNVYALNSNEIANLLKSSFNLDAVGVANILRYVVFDDAAITKAWKDIFDLGVIEIANLWISNFAFGLFGFGFDESVVTKAWKDVFGLAPTDISTLWRDSFSKDGGWVANQLLNITDTGFITAVLKDQFNFSPVDIAGLWRNTYNIDATGVANLLLGIQVEPNTIIAIWKNTFGLEAVEVANLWKGTLGGDESFITKAWKDVFGLDSNNIARLWRDNFDLDSAWIANQLLYIADTSTITATFLNSLGISPTEITDIWANVYHLTATDIAQLLRRNGVDPSTITKILQNKFNFWSADIARFWKDSFGMSSEWIANQLLQVTNISEVASTLKWILGVETADVTKLLKNVYNLDLPQISNILLSAVVPDVSAVQSALVGAGFPASEVDKTLQSLPILTTISVPSVSMDNSPLDDFIKKLPFPKI
ncbi:hypothetical protein H6F93_00275 [Leptolyngbya sp. FACHB-671]|uniref:hypothetical protein n=1 Tax=Leptolyngbya sp. FACHB-671 TaxID=2692812 RepID=UPI001687D271|nr:hypothetical protein [Leptolyngbya sp. FACHB-671]MBD2065989.1 hypothetical protein [Leptolyngbya sp. FACHB-671]